MSTTDAEAMKEYAAAGVDLPELAEEGEPKSGEGETPKPGQEAPKDPNEAPAAPTGEEPKAPEDQAPSQEPKEPRKRSIYDDLKDKKADLKTEKELREQAERERDEWKAKAEAVAAAPTPEKKQEAQDALEAFAAKIGADPAAIREMRDLFLQGVTPQLPEELAAGLKEFEEWRNTNQRALETQQFNEEYQSALPKLKQLFPTASDEELGAVRAELEKLAFTKDWHDKSLHYIAFENQEALGKLISPKKAGLERKGRADSQAVEFEFDPNADYSKLSPEDKVKWEEEYAKLTAKSDGLVEGADGKKILI